MHINGNAAAAEGDIVSPHLTGATVDIAKHDLTLRPKSPGCAPACSPSSSPAKSTWRRSSSRPAFTSPSTRATSQPHPSASVTLRLSRAARVPRPVIPANSIAFPGSADAADSACFAFNRKSSHPVGFRGTIAGKRISSPGSCSFRCAMELRVAGRWKCNRAPAPAVSFRRQVRPPDPSFNLRGDP